MNKARRLQTPAIPDTQMFDIPELYTKTLRKESFLCLDKSLKRKTRMLLFASPEQLKLLFQSSVVLMDGTFSASPSIFDQVYCIHAIKYEQCTYKYPLEEHLESLSFISKHLFAYLDFYLTEENPLTRFYFVNYKISLLT